MTELNNYNSIVVMKSFKFDKNHPFDYRYIEEGYTFLWKTKEDMLKYLDEFSAGGDDRPFEHRWDYVVAEYVTYGPYSCHEVIGWWQVVPKENANYANAFEMKPIDCPIKSYNGESYPLEGIEFDCFTISS